MRTGGGGAGTDARPRSERRLFRVRSLPLVVALLLQVSGAPASAPRLEQRPALECGERLDVPAIPNVMEARWSPDSKTLALVWFAQLPSKRSVTGYVEQEIVDTLDVATGRLWPVGVGDEADWSATGTFISYWGPGGEELRVARDGRIVARIVPTVPRIHWAGDGLVFIEKDEIREWRDGAVHTIAKLAADVVPTYPRDDVYFSGDGEHFTVTRYSQDGTLQRFLGTTRTGAVESLNADTARLVEWAPAGDALLVRYLDRLELRDPQQGTRSVSLAGGAATVHEWAPDGRTLLIGRVSPVLPGGDALDGFRVWPSTSGPFAASLPNLLGARSFSPDGKYFVGVSRTGTQTTRLEVYRCGDGTTAPPVTDSAARLAAIDAGPGRLVRPTAGEITQFVQGSHTGVDVAAPYGSIITADDDGVIDASGFVAVGGNRVCVLHSASLESCVYHTSAPLVTIGDRVVRGQPIALIGLTGVTTGPHTHWEVKQAGRIVDPLAH